MNTNKNFYIYENGKMKNRDKCNAMGKVLYSAFSILKDKHNYYFPQIQSIKVTSQDRSLNTKSAHYKEGKACDIAIYPRYLMPYYAGLIHTLHPFNVYLGMWEQKDDGTVYENQHIHFDGDYSKRKDSLYVEGFNKELNLITNNNIKDILKLYKAADITSDYNKYEKEVRKLLLTTKKEDISIYTRETPKDKVMKTAAKMPDLSDWFEKAKTIVIIGGVGFVGYKIYKIIKR